MRTRFPAVILVATSMTLLGTFASHGLGQTQEPKVPAEINAQFADPDVKAFVDRFESESREVAAKRNAIVDSLAIKPGMRVADVGAGTGLFTRLLAEKVGTAGKVHAVDISESFLKHIAEESKKLGQSQVTTLLGAQADAKLPANSVDLIFLCDVYHHVESPKAWLASLRKALKPDGRLVLIEFDRDAPGQRDFVKTHVRADKATFQKEFEAAGFTPIEIKGAPALSENFLQGYRKAELPSDR
ncbi:MAG: class I SAM-dependent methyltransferase [Isosphaeraceae bacterium]